MGRMSEYAIYLEDTLREELGIADDIEVRLEDYEHHDLPSPFQWFSDSLRLYDRQPDPTFDVFVSFASEHRESVARPLAERLKAAGLAVWFDEEQIHGHADVGINRGLTNSLCGVVLMSDEFFRKPFTLHELSGFAIAEVQSLVLVAYQLDRDAELLVEETAERLSGSVDVTYVRLRSQRISRLTQRVVLAVVRARGADRQVRAESAESQLITLANRYTSTRPDLRREDLRRQLSEHYDYLKDIADGSAFLDEEGSDISYRHGWQNDFMVEAREELENMESFSTSGLSNDELERALKERRWNGSSK